jgi:hypothetical protein
MYSDVSIGINRLAISGTRIGGSYKWQRRNGPGKPEGVLEKVKVRGA